MASPKYFGRIGWDKPFIWGDSGVAFFFVLSGFLILWIHLKDIDRPDRLFIYAKKRIIRIYPLYWLIFAVVFCGALLSPSSAAVPHDFLTITKSLLLLPQDAAVVGGNGAPVIFVAWSLQYEIFFYALIASFVVRRWLGAACVVLLLVNFLACNSVECEFPSTFAANPFVFLFAIGAAVVGLARLRIGLSWARALSASSAFLFLICGVVEAIGGTHMLPLDRRLIYGLLSGLLVLGLVVQDREAPLRYPRALCLLGDASYSLYLIHNPLISLLFKVAMVLGLAHAGIAGAVATYCFSLAVCLIGATQLHLHIEKPLLDRLNKFGDSQPARARAPAR